MAKGVVKMPEEFMKKLDTLGIKTDEIVEEVLKAGGEVVLTAVKSNLKGTVGVNTKHESVSTGELERALGISKVDVDKNGNSNVKIGFAEPRKEQGNAKYTKTNAMIANIIEYGKSDTPAKPFLARAKSKTRNTCKKAMEEKLDEEIKNA